MAFPERIVCLTEETTETLYLLGEQDRIVGISGFTMRPPEARKEKPKVSLFTDANIEEIKSLSPDLVIGFSDIQAELSKKLIQAGLNVFTFNQRSIAEILDTIRVLSLLIDAKSKGVMLLEKIHNNLSDIRRSSSTLSRHPSVYFEEWPDPQICGIRWVSELIELAGGKDICREQSFSPLAKDRIIAHPDSIIESNPDVIMASWCGKMVKPEKIKARPGWERITAVKQNQINEIHSSIILQPGPAALLEGVNAMHEIVKKRCEQSGN